MSDRKRRFTVESLFTDTRPQAAGVSDLPGSNLIALDRIDPDPDQPRRTFDEDRLDELAASIRIEGVLQPIVVRYEPSVDRYILIHGERRWRASQRAGLIEIPALVRDVPAERRLIQQLMENIVRDDLNPVDRAAALRILKEQLGDPPWEAVAEAVGIKRSRLFQLLSTENLPDPIQDDIRSGRLSEKQSRALQNLDPHLQGALRDLMLAGETRQAEVEPIARILRTAGQPADAEAARTMVEEAARHVRTTGDRPAPAKPATDQDAQAILHLLAEVARGRSEAAEQLAGAISGQSAARYSHRKFEDTLRTQAYLLAGLHSASRKEQELARPALETLRDTLNALLDAD